MKQALDALSREDREILGLRHIERLDTARIALAFGISEGAVKARLLRALIRLGRLMEPRA
jgi:RNA polymerase sigma-70 factor, ECF subfamily